MWVLNTFDQISTQKTAAKVKNIHMEEKPSYAYLCICLWAKNITATSMKMDARIGMGGD